MSNNYKARFKFLIGRLKFSDGHYYFGEYIMSNYDNIGSALSCIGSYEGNKNGGI
nr:MAG TPA: hypothetical protein [Caudoviricetes sp.]